MGSRAYSRRTLETPMLYRLVDAKSTFSVQAALMVRVVGS